MYSGEARGSSTNKRKGTTITFFRCTALGILCNHCHAFHFSSVAIRVHFNCSCHKGLIYIPNLTKNDKLKLLGFINPMFVQRIRKYYNSMAFVSFYHCGRTFQINVQIALKYEDIFIEIFRLIVISFEKNGPT